MGIENNYQGDEDLNNNLNLLANVACEQQLFTSKRDEEAKQLVFLKIESLEDIENNYQGDEDLNNNLNLLADVACEQQLLSSKRDEELKQRVFLQLESLREYAIYYQKNIKNLEDKQINNLIENKFSGFKDNQNLYSTSSSKRSLPQM